MTVQAPYFDDLARGEVFDAPSLTLTDGHAAVHQAICGDRLALALDAEMARAVTGGPGAIVHPNLVCDVAIGHSSVVTQRVVANLFYRGLVLRTPVFVGDTLRTRTEVVALRQNRSRPSGMAVLRIRTVNQRGEQVLDFWRCPMLPTRGPDVVTGHADDLEAIGADVSDADVRAAVPEGWRLDVWRERAIAGGSDRPGSGAELEASGAHTVTGAPELARLTLNLAHAHLDAGASTYGRRLVYGGHTIAVAAAHATQVLPGIVTILAWHRCDHVGPVFEDDVLRTALTVESVTALADGALADLRARVTAHRPDADPTPVLDWRFVALVA